MPDPPSPPKRRFQPPTTLSISPGVSPGTSGPGVQSPDPDAAFRGSYAELHCRTNFSFLEGASHPDELVLRAAELGYRALAITDRNSLAGVVRAHDAAKELKLDLLIGAEITPLDALPVVLLAPDRSAYGRLVRLITRGRRAAPKGECRLTFDDVSAHAAGLLGCVLLDPKHSSADSLHRYRDLFADRCYALAEIHHGPDDRLLLHRLSDMAQRARLPLVAANGVHYHVPERRFLQDVLTAIRERSTVAELGDRIFPNGERHLKTPRQMAELFVEFPDAIRRTREVAERSTFSLDELRYEYPEELCPPGQTPIAHLTRLTWEGARTRYPEGIPDKVRTAIEHELKLVEELRYEAYFLTVWDLVRFARQKGILCQGRGAAANSAICYCLEVTSVDPGKIDLLFERFISKERNEPPDIDVDFEHERREEVIQYVYDKYGRDRAGMTAEVITYRLRSAARDVGKALGLSLDRVDRMAKALDYRRGDLDGRRGNEELQHGLHDAGLSPASRLGRQFAALVRELLGFPRHLSQHVGGMVITQGPLCELVPIENASMPDRTVIEWDKDDLDAIGILKVDCLALGMLTAIEKSFRLLERHHRRLLTLATVPAEDPAVYEMVSRADTIGVFQIESRAQMSMLPRLRPQRFYDLVIEVAIVRPGPIQGNMVHPYLRRRMHEEPVDYPDDRIRTVLERTLGVPIFQEQAMRLAVVAAGFTPGEADRLRRAMGAWRKTGVIDEFREKLIGGMRANGYADEFAERVFKQLRGFGEYGFPESHAASFALLVYVSAWIKRYYPEVFAAALLNSQPMGFYAPAQLIADARKHGVTVLPIDVNFSDWDCTLEAAPPTQEATEQSAFGIRLGFRMIRGLSQAHAERISQCRRRGAFSEFEDFAQRTMLSNSVLTRLSRADAFRSLGLNRRTALWRSLAERQTLPLLAHSPDPEPEVELDPPTLQEDVIADYRTAGLSLRDHPLKFIRPMLDKLRAARAAELATIPDGRRVKVGGLVLLRQRPGTASGITFVTLEDETGMANLIIHPSVWERYRRVCRQAQAMLVYGTLQRQDQIIHLLVDKLEDLTALVAELRTQSRDFR